MPFSQKGKNIIVFAEYIQDINNKIQNSRFVQHFENLLLSTISWTLPLIYFCSVNYDSLNPEDTSTKELLANAKYTISLGRKIGASIFIGPEDIVELNPRMIFLLLTALMTVDLKK